MLNRSFDLRSGLPPALRAARTRNGDRGCESKGRVLLCSSGAVSSVVCCLRVLFVCAQSFLRVCPCSLLMSSRAAAAVSSSPPAARSAAHRTPVNMATRPPNAAAASSTPTATATAATPAAASSGRTAEQLDRARLDCQSRTHARSVAAGLLPSPLHVGFQADRCGALCVCTCVCASAFFSSSELLARKSDCLLDSSGHACTSRSRSHRERERSRHHEAVAITRGRAGAGRVDVQLRQRVES